MKTFRLFNDQDRLLGEGVIFSEGVVVIYPVERERSRKGSNAIRTFKSLSSLKLQLSVNPKPTILKFENGEFLNVTPEHPSSASVVPELFLR